MCCRRKARRTLGLAGAAALALGATQRLGQRLAAVAGGLTFSPRVRRAVVSCVCQIIGKRGSADMKTKYTVALSLCVGVAIGAIALLLPWVQTCWATCRTTSATPVALDD